MHTLARQREETAFEMRREIWPSWHMLLSKPVHENDQGRQAMQHADVERQGNASLENLPPAYHEKRSWPQYFMSTGDDVRTAALKRPAASMTWLHHGC